MSQSKPPSPEEILSELKSFFFSKKIPESGAPGSEPPLGGLGSSWFWLVPVFLLLTWLVTGFYVVDAKVAGCYLALWAFCWCD